MTHSVLIVEDDAAIAAVIAEALGEEGYDVVLCSRIDRRDALLAERSFDVMLTDVMLEDGDGLASIAAVHVAAPQMPIIVLSAQNTLDTAVRASDSQAFEYFPKPFDLDELTKAVAQAAARRPSPGPRSDPAEDMPFIGRSQAMQGVYRMISRVLRNDLTVLVTANRAPARSWSPKPSTNSVPARPAPSSRSTRRRSRRI
jgi:two-component system, NtrC family, nitrogen regulation response regulator GlnG